MSNQDNAEAKAVNSGQDSGAKSQDKRSLPMVDFSTFVLSMASSGLFHLGEVPDPETGKKTENLHMAKHSIDVLTMLRDKVEQGFTPEEKTLMNDLLYELRMKYVLKSK